MMVIGVDIIYLKGLQRAVGSRKNVLSASTLPVGAQKRVEAAFRRDYQLVPVGHKVLTNDSTEIVFGFSIGRAIAVRYIKMKNPILKSGPNRFPHGLIRIQLPEKVI